MFSFLRHFFAVLAALFSPFFVKEGRNRLYRKIFYLFLLSKLCMVLSFLCFFGKCALFPPGEAPGGPGPLFSSPPLHFPVGCAIIILQMGQTVSILCPFAKPHDKLNMGRRPASCRKWNGVRFPTSGSL